MRVAFLAYGTRGDIQPVLAIGDELRRRGHSVVAAVNEDLAEWVRGAGFEVVPMQLDLARFLSSRQAQSFLANGRASLLLRRIIENERAANDSIVRACSQACANADLVLSTITMAYRGYCMADATGIPNRTLLYFPVLETGDWASLLTGIRDFRMPWLNRMSTRALRRVEWKLLRPNIDDMCDRLRIPRYRHRPRFEDRPTLNTYSPSVAVRPADWHPRHEVVGWTSWPRSLRERLGEGALPADLAGWLHSGPPPVYLGLGSMPVLDPGRMLRDVAEVTARLKVRALIGAGWTDFGDVAGELPGDVHLATAAFDHDLVLPHCRAAVHHGGSGTTATVLRAGLPSVVTSVLADQPYWGWRLERAGAGVTMPFRKVGADRLGAGLARVLQDGYTARAQAIGAQVRREDGTRSAADTIERWVAAAARER